MTLGLEGGDLIEERKVSGPLPEQIRSCLDSLNSVSDIVLEKVPNRLEVDRTVAYPYEAMEEAVVNAVYHRSYDNTVEPTKVYLYPDRMEIISYPGPVQECYNAQIAVDGEHQIIVATEVSAEASDQGQMMGLLEEVEETFEEKPKQVLADAGYCNEADLQALEAWGVEGYVALGREGKQAVGVDPRKYPARSRMSKKLASLAGQVAYARRKWIAEAPHGWIKEGLGFRRFSLRGLNSVGGEWDLVCLALNIKRMSALMAA